MANQDPKGIQDVMSLTNLNLDDARLLLEICNGDPDRAVWDYFEDNDILQKHRAKQVEDRRWREDYFASDHDGNNVPSFKIHGPDVAPLRPNSRTTNTSPNRDVIDLSSDAAAGALWEQYYESNGKANPTSAADPSKSWGFEQNSDADMDRALRASLVEAGIGGPQETGVIGGMGGQQFGPANRPDYNNDEWAMVPLGTSSTAHEIFLDPDPADRKRGEGAPAFLKPSPDDSRIGALLTIFHEIPLVRELLLRRDHSAPDYGHDNEWWMGKKIEIPKLIVSADLEGEMEGVSQNHDLTEELQRLMAFLDETDRSYGSAENIIRLLPDKSNGLDTMSLFFDQYQDTLPEEARNSFLSTALQPISDNQDERREFSYLEVSNSGVSESQNLYDCLDSVLWRESGLEWENSAFLRHLGEVLTFKLKGKSQFKSINIPLVWYPDRYLESNRETALEMRTRKDLIKQKITKMDLLKDRLTNFSKNGKTYKVRDLINASLTHDDRERPTTEAATPLEPDTKVDDIDFEKQTALNRLSDQLRRTMTSIDEKLALLEQEKAKVQASLQELSEFYTQYADGMHTYTLRGISTASNITYINQISFPENDTETSDTNVPKGQWWKISFVAGEQYPVTVHTVTEDEVTKAAEESQEPILVYASQRAMHPTLTPLSAPLSHFVELDNQAFKAEISVGEMGLPGLAQEMSMMTTPHSPGKRKFNENGEEEEGAYRESPGRRGSMDVNYEDEDWMVEEPMSTGTFSDAFAEAEVEKPVQQEMVERSKGGLGMLGIGGSGGVGDVGDASDVMDDVVMDEEKVGESAAVKELGAVDPAW